MFRSYYDVLQVSTAADTRVIRAACRMLSQINHPDKGGKTERIQEINEAYETLIDKQRRTGYDLWLKARVDSESAVDVRRAPPKKEAEDRPKGNTRPMAAERDSGFMGIKDDFRGQSPIAIIIAAIFLLSVSSAAAYLFRGYEGVKHLLGMIALGTLIMGLGVFFNWVLNCLLKALRQ